METALLVAGTDAGAFAQAQSVYEKGGNSKSFAEVTLTAGLPFRINRGAVFTGTAVDGSTVGGVAMDNYDAGATIIRIQYETSAVQENYVGCRVGGLPASAQMTDGCMLPVASSLESSNKALIV